MPCGDNIIFFPKIFANKKIKKFLSSNIHVYVECILCFDKFQNREIVNY